MMTTTPLKPAAEALPDVSEVSRFLDLISPMIRDARIAATRVCIGHGEAREKMASGRTLLYGLDLEIDVAAASEFLLRLVSAACGLGSGNVLASSACRIKEKLSNGEIAPGLLLKQMMSGDEQSVVVQAGQRGLDSALLTVLLQNALRPVFFSWRRQLDPFLKDGEWTRGYCPVCSCLPIFGELRGNNQALYLRCGRCGSDWPFRRLACSHCGNDDHRAVGFLYNDEDRGKRRADFCDKCKGYLKVIASFDPFEPERLQIEDVATIRLDMAAEARGYKRHVEKSFKEEAR